MKRVFSALMAGALTVAMAVPAFAAPALADKVYNSDGDVISVPNTGDVYGDDVRAPYISTSTGSINIDGVLPGITMYIPLEASMDSKVVETAWDASDHIDALAAEATGVDAATTDTGKYFLKISDGSLVQGVDTTGITDAATTLAKDSDGKYYYFDSNSTTTGSWADAIAAVKATLPKLTLDSVTNDDYFKFDVDKDDGSKYVKKIEVVDDKKLGTLDRTAYLKIELADSTTTSDLKSTGTITFKAKADSSSYTSGSKKLTNGDVWASGDTLTLNYTFWINNNKASNDSNVDTGDRVYFDPDDNEDNTLVWGDDRAALYFESNDDAGKFYARLQTKSDSEIYSTYGDPVNADLWFFDFVSNPTIPSTSRATLTLGIPWDEDDDYTPNPEDCFIYEKDADGNLVDVTSSFTYDEDNDGTTEIPGWTIKTRTLGTYVISDTELDLDVIDDVDEEEVEDDTDTTVDTGKEIPNTGSSDMVGVAVVAAVVSLAAAGAVAFKKASK